MPLQKKNLELPMIAGVDTKVDPKQIKIGKLLSAKNCEFRKPGKINKRSGFTNIGNTIIDNGQSITAGNAIMTYKEELLAFDKENIYSYVAGNDAWKDKGDFQSVYSTSNVVSNGTGREYMQDSAYFTGTIGSLEAYIYMRESNGVKTVLYQIADSTTKQLIVGPVPITTVGFNPKVEVIDDTFVFYYYNTSTTQIYVATLGTTNLTAPLLFSPITGVGADQWSVDPADPEYAVAVMPSSSTSPAQIVLAFNNASVLSAGITLRTYRVATGFLVFVNQAFINNGGLQMVSGCLVADLVGTARNIQFFFTERVGNRLWRYQYTNALGLVGFSSVIEPSAVGLVRVTAVYTGTSTAREFKIFIDYLVTDGATSTSRWQTSAYTYTAAMLKDWEQQQIFIAGGAFNYNSKAYFIACGGADIYTPIFSIVKPSTYFLIDESGEVVGRAFSDEAVNTYEEEVPFGLLNNLYYYSKSNTISTTEFFTPIRTLVEFNPINGFLPTGIRTYNNDFFEPQKAYSNDEIAQSLYIGGGMLFQYDGQNLVEDSFNFDPLIQNASPNTGGTGFTYKYVAVWEWVDNQGNTHRSAPSDPYTVVTSATIGSAPGFYTENIRCYPLGLTLKTPSNNRSPVLCALYRTKANDPIYYRLPLTDANTNITTATWITPANDITPDDDLTVKLYTEGEVSNDAPPPIGALAIYRDRLFALDSTDPLVVYYSKKVNFATTVDWSDAFVINVDPTGGPVTALAAMDDKLIIFKENSIRYITGQGPDPDLTNNDYGSTTLITTDAGCDNTRSIVNTPEGIIFKSSKGVYFLNRGLQVSYIGAPVEEWNEFRVTSAVLMTANNQIRITLENNVILVYDYYVENWAIFTPLSAVDSVIWKGKHAFITAEGFVSVQDLDGIVYTDNTTSYPMEVMTGWLPFAGIQGFQRVYKMTLLGTFKSVHELQCELYYDYNDASAQTITVVPQIPSLYGGPSPYGSGSPYGDSFDLYQYELRPARQKCMSIKMKINDIASTGTPLAEGYDLSNIRLSYGVEGGSNRVRNQQTFGS